MENKKITASELSEKLNNGECVLIDVREPDEYKFEHIPGSINSPLSTLNSEMLNKLRIKDECVVTCKSGKRAEKAAKNLNYENVYILDGGIDSWKKDSLDIAKPKKQQLPTMRVVQIVAGSLVLIFSMLTFVNQSFIVVPIFIGAGLTFAGLSGWCGMAILIEKIRGISNASACSVK